LSRNYPEILGCQQANEGSMSRPEPSDAIQSALSTFHIASLLDYDHLCGFQNLNTNSYVRNLSFLTQNTMIMSLLMAPLLTSLHFKSTC